MAASNGRRQRRSTGSQQGECGMLNRPRTLGWILERVPRFDADGHLRDSIVIHEQIRHELWYSQARYLGTSGKWALFERPDPGMLKNTAIQHDPIEGIEKYRSVS